MSRETGGEGGDCTLQHPTVARPAESPAQTPARSHPGRLRATREGRRRPRSPEIASPRGMSGLQGPARLGGEVGRAEDAP